MTLQEFKTYAKDKSVILVGNSVEVMNHENADFIDSHDIVVRFGKAIESNEKEQIAIGKKLDVWVTGAFRADMLNKEIYRDLTKDSKILFNRSRICNKKPIKINKNLNDYLNMFEDNEVLEINKEYDIKDCDKESRRLSAGIWAIKFFVEKIKTQKSLDIIGFDFFAKKTNKKRGGTYEPSSWHIPISTGIKETHWHEQEVEIVNEYVSNGLLKWTKLTNLNKEWINESKYGRF